MELEDLSIVSLHHSFDYDINFKTKTQPTMREPSWITKAIYGRNAEPVMKELSKIAHAQAISRLYYNEVVFIPNIKPEYSARPDVRKFAHDTVRDLLLDLGFKVAETNVQGAKIVPICVHVPLNNKNNIRRMRIFGPYFMFDKKYMLTNSVLSGKNTHYR